MLAAAADGRANVATVASVNFWMNVNITIYSYTKQSWVEVLSAQENYENRGRLFERCSLNTRKQDAKLPTFWLNLTLHDVTLWHDRYLLFGKWGCDSDASHMIFARKSLRSNSSRCRYLCTIQFGRGRNSDFLRRSSKKESIQTYGACLLRPILL